MSLAGMPAAFASFGWERIRGVVFDFGGVISVAPRRADTGDWALYDICAPWGVPRACLEAGWHAYRAAWDGGLISFDEMYRRIFASAGVTLTPEMREALWQADPVGWIRELRADTLSFMRTLKAAGFRLGILSNMSPDFHEKLFAPRAAAYRELADVEVISGFEKCCKPARAIYDLTASRMGMDPASLLFFDDTPENVAAACAYGWQAALYPASPVL